MVGRLEGDGGRGLLLGMHVVQVSVYLDFGSLFSNDLTRLVAQSCASTHISPVRRLFGCAGKIFVHLWAEVFGSGSEMIPGSCTSIGSLDMEGCQLLLLA